MEDPQPVTPGTNQALTLAYLYDFRHSSGNCLVECFFMIFADVYHGFTVPDGKQESYEDMNEPVYCYSVGYIVSSVRCSRLNGYHNVHKAAQQPSANTD